MHTASLSCHHQRRYKQHPPRKGEVIWCPRCSDWKRVVVVIGPWRAECHQCDYRIGGDNSKTIYANACEHAEQRSHEVSFWKSGSHDSRTLITRDTRGQGLLYFDAEQA